MSTEQDYPKCACFNCRNGIAHDRPGLEALRELLDRHPERAQRLWDSLSQMTAAPRYHVYWGHQHSLSRSFATFDAALHEYKLHAREHRDRVLVGRDSTAPRLLGAGHDGERDGLRDEEREAVEAVS